MSPGILLATVLVPLVGFGCRSNATARNGVPPEPDGSVNQDGPSPDAGGSDFPRAEVGFSFERFCTAETEGIKLVVAGATCTILGDVGRVRANLSTTSGNPLLAVTYAGLEPGQQSTAGDGLTDVILSGACPARAKDSPEPCSVELVELKRASTPASQGEVELGSSLTLRVSCPVSLTYDAVDVRGSTQQFPQRFEIHAENCTAF